MAGEHHDDAIHPPIQVRKAVGKRQATRIRHIRIQQQEVIGITPVAGRDEGRKHRLTVPCMLRAQATARQGATQIRAECCIGRTHQYTRSREARRHALCPSGNRAQRQGEAEGTPRAGPALDLDAPMHQLDELTRDREAQPRTAILARRGGVCLGKCSKNRLELVRRNAASRVAHREPQLIDLLAALGTFHAHADLAPLGEFHCVANQVDQYLPQACRITPQHPGNVRVDVMEQFDALL